jgi:DNA repair exonuclease SbcCD ATPase subunit
MNDDEFDEEEDDYGASSSIPAFILPFVTAGAALLVGALLGGLIIWLLKPAETKTVEVPRDLTQEELEEVCAPFIIEKDDEVQAVQAKMVTLAKDLKAKREEVEELKKKIAGQGGGGGGSALRAELEKAKRQIAEMTEELETVKAERDQLIVDLRKTIVQLEEAEARAEFEAEQKELYKADALVNKWKHFKAQSTVDICDHGGRKKMGRCRETVAEMMTDAAWNEFKHCVLAGQAVPTVREIDSKKETLPEYSRYMDQENKVVKDWAILLCDPTLPEADLEHEGVEIGASAPPD